jgi:hypothetical protein
MQHELSEFQKLTLKLINTMFLENRDNQQGLILQDFEAKGIDETFLYIKISFRGTEIEIYL